MAVWNTFGFLEGYHILFWKCMFLSRGHKENFSWLRNEKVSQKEQDKITPYSQNCFGCEILDDAITLKQNI